MHWSSNRRFPTCLYPATFLLLLANYYGHWNKPELTNPFVLGWILWSCPKEPILFYLEFKVVYIYISSKNVDPPGRSALNAVSSLRLGNLLVAVPTYFARKLFLTHLFVRYEISWHSSGLLSPHMYSSSQVETNKRRGEIVVLWLLIFGKT